MGKKSGGSDDLAAQARQDELNRQSTIRDGTARIDDIFGKSFTDDFYNGRRDAYTDYAMPQLDKQFDEAKRQLTFDLARSGNLNSSARAKQEGDLGTLYDTNKQAVDATALDQENSARNAVEGARSDLMTTLNSTGDATAAANDAINRSAALSMPAPFNPLSNMFASFTSALGTQAAAERAQALSGGTYQAPFNTGLFAPSTSAVKVT